jgi:hypothetical protein
VERIDGKGAGYMNPRSARFKTAFWYMPRYAAGDIGSNSIRMAAAEALPGSGTRLGESVFRNGIAQ